MRIVRALVVGLGMVAGLAGAGAMSGASAPVANEAVTTAAVPTYTGRYEMYATIALVPVSHFEYQAIIKPGRPPVHLDVTGVQGPLDHLLGKTVRAHGRYRTGTNMNGQRVRYMVVQRLEIVR